MTMISDNEVLKTKIDHAREDIRKLYPLLELLEPQDRDQISGFAEKLMGLMVEIREGYTEQDRQFRAMRQSFEEVNRKLDFLLEVDEEDEGTG
jgi:predicted nucleotide-binding protein (sugar kinase/HSP70/actin superfamily)